MEPQHIERLRERQRAHRALERHDNALAWFILSLLAGLVLLAAVRL